MGRGETDKLYRRYMKRFVIVVVLSRVLAAQTPVDFTREIQPLLKNQCYGCHSGTRPSGGLRLDVRSLASRAIVPGHPADSKLLKRIAGEGGEARMPLGMSPLSSGQ